jgi:hypothetical protein
MMERLSHTLDACGAKFVAKVVSQTQFRQTGIAYGRDSSCAWVIVDPRAHPLQVWQKRRGGAASYSDTAIARDFAMFTNGPMMGRRLSPRSKLTRRRVAWEFIAAAVGAGATAAFGLGRAGFSRYALGAIGAACGSVHAWRRSFTQWRPCGHVISAEHRIRQQVSFDHESPRHSWLGRFSTDFRSYAIGYGDLPGDVVEGMGGLILLVQDFAPVRGSGTGVGSGSDFAQLSHKRGIVAWGLVPLRMSGDPDLTGVIAVLGSRKALDAAMAARLLCRIGARDAVGLDQSGSAMMGARQSFLVGPPPLHRQAMQTYGLCCA